MKVKVTEDCVGCGACADTCPEVFLLGDDGFAHVKEEALKDKALAPKIREAAENCPTEAIAVEE